MKKYLACIWIVFFAITTMVARHHTPAGFSSTGDTILDSLVVALNRQDHKFSDIGIGRVKVNAIVQGTSECTRSNKLTRLMSDILPFHWREEKNEFEALIQGSYQYPCNLLITPVSVFSNSRHSRKAVREIKKIIMPLEGMTIMNDKGSDKAFVAPFSDDGLEQYHFSIDTVAAQLYTQIIVIHFSPKRKNHTLIEGNAWISKDKQKIIRIDFQGLVDFGHVYDTIYYKNEGAPYVDRSKIQIDYRFGRTRGTNRFDCLYETTQFTTLEQLKAEEKDYNLSDVYQTFSTQYLGLPGTILNEKEEETNEEQAEEQQPEQKKRHEVAIEKLPKQLVGRSGFNAFGTDIRVNGPLNPASVGYDKRNGITLRERINLTHNFKNGERLKIAPEIGYSFGYHQLRYKVSCDWLFNPRRRGALTFSSRNTASGFSSKFKESVDQSIKDYQNRFEHDRKNPWSQKMDFDDLELYFFHHYETKAELSYEIANGMMAYMGAFYNYRTPERHGSRAISTEQFNELVKGHYADLNPFIRLEYTPGQYYYYNNNYKQYLESCWPTFSFEMAQGIYGWFGSTSNYSRIELDAQQNIPIGANRSFSYHIGAGTFFRQSGEYFINYHYFERSQYPNTWGEKIGGSFTLLNDYWYCSSPAYLQTHFMYESPFMVLNKIPAISKYVIKERIYLSHLLADGKNSYLEFGYGMGNNYFNIGAFGSMVGLKMWDAGIKFTIEIDQHL